MNNNEGLTGKQTRKKLTAVAENRISIMRWIQRDDCAPTARGNKKKTQPGATLKVQLDYVTTRGTYNV